MGTHIFTFQVFKKIYVVILASELLFQLMFQVTDIANTSFPHSVPFFLPILSTIHLLKGLFFLIIFVLPHMHSMWYHFDYFKKSHRYHTMILQLFHSILYFRDLLVQIHVDFVHSF